MHENQNASPFQSVPQIVVVIATVLFGIECILTAADQGLIGGADAIGWRLLAIQEYGFSAPVFNWMIENNRYPSDIVLRFISYPILHSGFTHMIFAVVFVLAIGKAVSHFFGPWRFLGFFFGGSVFGAIVYGFLVSTNVTLIGGMPGAYALIGAFTYALLVQARAVGDAPIRAFSLIAMLAAIQLIFGVLFGAGPYWIAELAAFVFGFGISFILVPGGWSRILITLRRR